MKLSALQTFLTIIETGSLSRASEKLNVTQSTITARLQALEDDFAVLVVARHEVGAMRIKVFDVKEAIGAHGAYAVGRFPTAVTGGEDRLLGLVVCT